MHTVSIGTGQSTHFPLEILGSWNISVISTILVVNKSIRIPDWRFFHPKSGDFVHLLTKKMFTCILILNFCHEGPHDRLLLFYFLLFGFLSYRLKQPSAKMNKIRVRIRINNLFVNYCTKSLELGWKDHQSNLVFLYFYF